MRQAQNAKRVRGRGRKMVNQLSRTMDSNGPDVKIRGTASHIYDKYQALARDANSSGDRVMAENYLQHAEHYFRLINALQTAATNPAQPGANGARASEVEEGVEEEQPAVAAVPEPQPQQRAPRGEGKSSSRSTERGDKAEKSGRSSATRTGRTRRRPAVVQPATDEPAQPQPELALDREADAPAEASA